MLFLLLFHLHPYAHRRCWAAESNQIAINQHLPQAAVEK
jgi:hypothetical protein